MIVAWMISASFAAPSGLVMERLAEVEPLRAYRMARSAPVLSENRSAGTPRRRSSDT